MFLFLLDHLRVVIAVVSEWPSCFHFQQPAATFVWASRLANPSPPPSSWSSSRGAWRLCERQRSQQPAATSARASRSANPWPPSSSCPHHGVHTACRTAASILLASATSGWYCLRNATFVLKDADRRIRQHRRPRATIAGSSRLPPSCEHLVAAFWCGWCRVLIPSQSILQH
jgi:hypothetical protein